MEATVRVHVWMKQTVLLVDYGGPQRLDEVHAYLRRLFNEPSILSMPSFIRRPLANWIARRRLPKAIEIYKQLGGASPVNATVRTLCDKLNRSQKEVIFRPAFLLHPPFLVDELKRCPAALIFPLFPQEAFATWGMIHEKTRLFRQTVCVRPYYVQPDFIQLLVDRIEIHLKHSPKSKNTFILCTAHAIPLRHVRRGDRYVSQLTEQVQILSQHFPEFSVKLGYQSRLGSVRWTEPRLESVLAWAKTQGYDSAIVLPLSFTIDNSETLIELDRHYAMLAKDYGIMSWERVPCFNTDQDFQAFILEVVGYCFKLG